MISNMRVWFRRSEFQDIFCPEKVRLEGAYFCLLDPIG